VNKYGYVQKAVGNEMFLASSLEMALQLHEANNKLHQESLMRENIHYLPFRLSI